MNDFKPDLLFYCDLGPDFPGWHETLAVLSGEKDMETALVRRLTAFAAEFSLSGNIWQQWLTYVLMMHENPFSLACERKKVRSSSTLFRLACADLEVFRRLFSLDPDDCPEMARLNALLAYSSPYETEQTDSTGGKILALSRELAQAEDAEAFARLVTGYYETRGVGIYGLFRAFRISDSAAELQLVPVTEDSDVCFDDLIGLEEQKKTLRDNTEAFVKGIPANNVLLYGDSGTGKSTSVHALMHDFYDQGLRLVELSKQHRHLLPQVMAAVKKRDYRFIIFLDDLSFEEDESDYKELKAMLEGALEKRADRVLIYATSNRRHLIRETWRDRNDMEYQEDIHHSDTMEEKLSLASRFGIAIYYSKPNAKEYLHIVRELSLRSGIEMNEKELNDEARKWELRHGGMSGRTASQLITWIGGRAEINK